VLYHDTFWYPLNAKKKMREALDSGWGRLFHNWERLTPDEQGYPTLGEGPAEIKRTGLQAFWRSFGVLGTSIKEAPEFAARRRRSTHL
jgi:hypothetical protein